MANWTVAFESKGGIGYEIEIGGFSSARTLTGGDNPFETQEDDSDDMFEAVRLQSGYLRLLDADGGLMWRVMPATATGHPVVLRRTDAGRERVMWRGYIKQDSYAGDLFAFPNVISVPVVCQLSVLEAYDAELTAGDVPNLAGLLYYILTRAGEWTYVICQGTDGFASWLTSRVLASNFFERSSLMQVDWKYNCLELLEDICLFLGVTARTEGGNLWLCAADADVAADGWEVVTMSELETLAAGGSVQPNTLSWDAYDADDLFADTTSQALYVNGIRKASVEGDVNEVDVLMEMPTEQVEAIMERNPTTDGQVTRSDYGGSLHVFRRRLLTETSVDDALARWSWNVNDVYVLSEDVYSGRLAFKHSMAWSWYVRMPSDSMSALTIVTHDAVWLVPGVLELAGSVQWQSYSTSGDGSVTVRPANGTMDVLVKCGDWYYDQGSTLEDKWTMYETWNTIAIGDEQGGTTGAGSIISNRLWNSTGPNYSGHGFTIVFPKAGRLEVRIRRIHLDGETDKTVYLGGLKVAMHALDVAGTPVRCTATNGTDYRTSVSRDVIFTTAAGVYGKGTLMNEDCTALGLMEYRGVRKRPEQWVADRIARYGNGAREVLRYVINVAGIGGELTPGTKLNADSITRWPMSVSRRWWDDEATVVMTEV